MKKKLWIVSELYYPSSTSTGYILTKISQGLVKKYTVNVITGPPSYWSKAENYLLKETINDISIYRAKIPYLDKNITIKRIFRLLLLTGKMAYLSLKRIDSDATLLVVTTPITFIFFVPVLKLFKRKLTIFILVHDVYPNNLSVAGLLKPDGLIYKILDKISIFSLSRANRLIVLGRDMQQLLNNKGLKDTTIIENWSENDIIDIQPTQYCNDQSTLKSVVFLFAGNIGRLQGISELLNSLKKVKSRNARFVFAGNGAMVETIRQFSHENPEIDIELIGTFDREQQESLIENCDIGLVTLSKGMFGLGVPSKAYNYFAGGKPILYIGDSDSEMDIVVSEFNVGWSIGADDTELMARTIDSICETDPAIITEFANNAKAIAIERYTLENTHKKYNSLFESVD